jgi:hypothetical protein
MKGGLIFRLLLPLAALSRAVGAQSASVPAGGYGSTGQVESAHLAVAFERAQNTGLPRLTFGVEQVNSHTAASGLQSQADLLMFGMPASAPAAGVKDYFFGTRKRSSNTLLIGGVGVGLIGVAVVKGNAGALLGVAGLLTSIGGLYLAF